MFRISITPDITRLRQRAENGFAIVLLTLIALFPSCRAQEQAQSNHQNCSNLLPGSYIFLDARSGEIVPKGFTINKSGDVHWHAYTKEVSEHLSSPSFTVKQPRKEGARAVNTKAENQLQWESYNYPTIKWKAHQITTIPDGVAQLSTTYEHSNSPYFLGTLRYKVTLFKAKSNGETIELLDENGFRVAQFYATGFHPVPGTDLLEATGTISCTEAHYKEARDYLVR